MIDQEKFQRGYEANQNGQCVICAVELGATVKATAKVNLGSHPVGICNLHAKALRYETANTKREERS